MLIASHIPSVAALLLFVRSAQQTPCIPHTTRRHSLSCGTMTAVAPRTTPAQRYCTSARAYDATRLHYGRPVAVRLPSTSSTSTPDPKRSMRRTLFLGSNPRALDTLAEAGAGSRNRCTFWYSRALQLAREEDYAGARAVFAALTSEYPDFYKAWVSWAQMEKRSNPDERFMRCREVLQRGLTSNPQSAALIQAWGLMELQRGNFFAAVLLLERCARTDPARCAPVLKWKPVREARQTVGARRRRYLTV